MLREERRVPKHSVGITWMLRDERLVPKHSVRHSEQWLVMNLDLTGRTALITGGAKRVGRAIAMTLAEHGANLIINYRHSADEAESAAEEIRQKGPMAWTLRADLAAEDELDGLIDRCAELAGRVDILINNASAFTENTIETVTLDALIASVRTEAWAPLVLGRSFAQKMGNGHIVNITDTRVYDHYDWNHFGYHAAKHMLALFTQEMAIKFAPEVAVNAVAPGLILPPEGKDMSYLDSLKDRIPLRMVGEPQYVADAVLYLVTSRFVTGQTIFVDGGRHLQELAGG